MTEFNPIQTNAIPVKLKLRNLVWKMVNMTFFRFSPPYLNIFGKYRVFLLRLFGAKLDWNVSIHPSSTIDYPWNLTMKNKASLGEKCWVYAMDSISIGEMTCIGKDVYLLTGTHNIEKSTFDLVTKPIKIGNGCWIATAAIILPGTEISDYCVVAANSVVTKNVEEFSVVGGNPANFIKKRIIKE